MPTLRRYHVVPNLPAVLEPLRELAYNLWWSWNPEAHELFVRIDPDLWEEVHGNPVELLARVPQKRLEELAIDDAFTSHLEDAIGKLRAYMNGKGWFERKFPDLANKSVAYFSMEYGLHESLPIYSGGLGVLAGDHLKTASDLGLPLYAIGLAYAEGYFRQALSADGWQEERYPLNDWNRLPVQPVFGADGERLLIKVRYPHGDVVAQLWKVQVGRIPLYLLDANLEVNRPDDRSITGPLYGGDKEFRVRQEVMLGIGGIHALAGVGHSPTVCHMNEGHSAFLALERIRRAMTEHGVSFSVGQLACAAGNVFTTHTPVPAGNDVFERNVVRRYLEPHRAALGLSEEDLLRLGRVDPNDATAGFSMPILAIKNAAHFNGVSALHGDVSKEMYRDLWPEFPVHEVPAESVTNGVHVPTWVSDDMSALYNRYLGPRWREQSDDVKLWERTNDIPDAELWAAHTHRRHRLIALCRKRLRQAGERRGASRGDLEAFDEVLDPNTLTIGFARRFATYKRAALLFSDLERVKKLLGDSKRPVQLVFAGKAHPQDKGGKELIRTIVKASREAGLQGRVVFVEDYDMRIARALVSGVDVWLNTPRRPMEASGTSGMKAAANGALNVSVLDGWWAEAWDTFGWPVGWAIGTGENSADDDGDRREAEALYHLLESEIVPLFYDRSENHQLPRGWVRKMKSAIQHLSPAFNTARMVREYTERFYVPSLRKATAMVDNDFAAAKEFAGWHARVEGGWGQVRVTDVKVGAKTELPYGQTLPIEATIALGPLQATDIAVEVYFGPTDGSLGVVRGESLRLAFVGAEGAVAKFAGAIPTKESGSHAFGVRVVPTNALFAQPREMPLVRWG